MRIQGESTQGEERRVKGEGWRKRRVEGEESEGEVRVKEGE